MFTGSGGTCPVNVTTLHQLMHVNLMHVVKHDLSNVHFIEISVI